MSKRSNRGKAYFYAMGQRDKHNGVVLDSNKQREMRVKLAWGIGIHAHHAWLSGYLGT